MWLLSVSACMVLKTPSDVNTGPDGEILDFLEEEKASREAYFATPLSFEGRLVGMDGQPQEGLTVEIQNQVTQSDSSGHFEFAELRRQNSNLSISGLGIRNELFPVHLAVDRSINGIVWPSLPLVEANDSAQRLYFTGDVALGRRFLELDPSERGVFPSEDPEALISVSDPVPGALSTIQWVKPFFDLADGAVLNLESPVTDDPQFPHPTKEHVFFTLPESLVILQELGIDFVSLGNNHIYDYLDQGLLDTFEALENWGVPYGGAGISPGLAWQPQQVTLGTNAYDLISASSIDGSVHDIGFSASDTQGGSADLLNTDDFLFAFADRQNPIIALFHTGNEYATFASEYSDSRAALAIESGAELVISHHPHVTQHWGMHEGKLIFHSLGNFIFDQVRMDTMMGVIAEIDMHETVSRARALPIYIEDYRPRPVSGALADRFLVGLTERSSQNGVDAVTHLGRSWIDDGQWVYSERSVDLIAVPNENGSAIVDLRSVLESGERIGDVLAQQGELRYGSDLMIYGDIEDYDIDDDDFEAARWDIEGDSRYVCTDNPYRGAAALCSVRAQTNTDSVSTAFRHRIRILNDEIGDANKAVSFVGARFEEGAGSNQVLIQFYASVGSASFGEQTILSSEGGQTDWELNWADIRIPDDPSNVMDVETETPRAIRVFLEHSPPLEGNGRLMWDDLALVMWENQPTHQISPTFLRLDGLSEQTMVTLTLLKAIRAE